MACHMSLSKTLFNNNIITYNINNVFQVLYDYARRIGHVSPNLLMEDDELNEEDEYQNEDYDFHYQDEMQTFKQK